MWQRLPTERGGEAASHSLSTFFSWTHQTIIINMFSFASLLLTPPAIFFLTPQGLVLCSAHFRWWYGSDWLSEWMSFFHFFDSLFFSQETGIIEFRLLDSWGTPPNLMLVSEGPTDLVVQGLVQTEAPTCPRRPFSNLQSRSSSQWIAPRLQKPE